MRINHNIAALNTYRQLTTNTSNTSKSLEKLSSGLRINRAGDDAAGLAISEKMRSQIRGLDTASKNANDGISLIQTAEGALNETHSILQRMKELAVQAASDTNTLEDRAEIQKEIDQLTTELTRISTDTEFNTKKLLDGSMASKTTVTGSHAGNVTSVAVAAGTPPQNGTYNVTVTKTNATGALTELVGSAGKVTFAASGVIADIKAGTYTFSKVGSDWKVNGETIAPAKLADYGLASTATGDVTVSLNITKAAEVTYAVKDAANKDVKASAFDIEFKGTVANNNHFSITVDNSDATIFHIGANQGQNTSLVINNMDAKSLGVDTLNLTTQKGADAAITTIDDAINQVSSQRAALGAMQNRLEHTINNLGTASENLSAAESRIRDVDMAKEMMEFTKNNILSQASQAMLAQANQQPQSILQLLQ